MVLDRRNLIVEFLHLLWDYIYCCYMMVLNFLPLRLSCKKSSTFLTKPLFPQEREDVTALLGARNRYALRLADHQRSTPVYAGWDRLIHPISHIL